MLVVGKIGQAHLIGFMDDFLNILGEQVDVWKLVLVVVEFFSSNDHPVPEFGHILVGHGAHRHLDFSTVVEPCEDFDGLEHPLSKLMKIVLTTVSRVHHQIVNYTSVFFLHVAIEFIYLIYFLQVLFGIHIFYVGVDRFLTDNKRCCSNCLTVNLDDD